MDKFIKIVAIIWVVGALTLFLNKSEPTPTPFQCYEDELATVDILGNNTCVHYENIERPAPPANQEIEAQLLSAINSERAIRGLGAVAYNGQLEVSADNKAADHVQHNYFAHDNPNGHEWTRFIRDTGYDEDIGENLAEGYNSVEAIIGAWINSPTHNAVMFNPAYDEIGISVMPFRKTNIIVTHYGG